MESALTSYRVASLRNVSANSLFAGSSVFASNLAVHHAHAAGKALERDGVLNRETPPWRSAASVQTLMILRSLSYTWHSSSESKPPRLPR